MLIVLNWFAVLYSNLIGQNKYTCQNFDQATALLESGEKLVTKIYFWPLCLKRVVASGQKANYGKMGEMKSQIPKYDRI